MDLHLEVWPNGKVLLNEFVVVEEIGEGGMGKVYLARSRSADHLFAVKRAKLLNEASRRTFQTELQIWIELPEHPHLVTCRFFRTIGDEIAIFAQYIEGGSLSDWIRDQRLKTVPQILDVAIQSAWGLHTLHELGLVHHDMKPSNVLMTSDGLAKMTDFGLAKVRASAGELPSTYRGHKSLLVSCGGRTPAYCSPEQAAGQGVTRKTDIWSWGVSLLEMFTGEVTWPAGQVADAAFEQYYAGLSAQGGEPGIVAMPRSVAMIVKKCLRKNPDDRWANLLIVAEELKKVYREITGRAYSRQTPSFPKRKAQAMSEEPLDDSSNAFRWLCLAHSAAGLGAPGNDLADRSPGSSAKVKAISDLAMFEEAQRILQRVVDAGRDDLRASLAALCLEKAQAHWQAEDFPGGLTCYDLVVELYRSSLHPDGQMKFPLELAVALSGKAGLLDSIGDLRSAEQTASEAIAILESLLAKQMSPDLQQVLAQAYQRKGSACYDMGDYPAALRAYDRVIAIYGQLQDHIGEPLISDLMAGAYMHKGNTVWSSGDPKGALVWHDKAIEAWERLVQAGQKRYARDLGKACYNKGITLRSSGDARQALACHDRGIEHYQRLVHDEGRWDIANELANVYLGRANAMRDLAQNRESLEWFERALEIYDTLVNQQGRQEFAGDFAAIRAKYATTLIALGDAERGMLEAERALPVLERESSRTGRSYYRGVFSELQASMRSGQPAAPAAKNAPVVAPQHDLEEAPASNASEDLFSFGKVMHVSRNEFTVREYDFAKDADVDQSYEVNANTEFGNIDSLAELKPGDDVVLDYSVQGRKRLVQTLVKEVRE